MAKNTPLKLEKEAKNNEIIEQNQKTILFMLEAKEWSECIDCLKKSVDSMYEICHLRHNVFGCEEALIYLQKAVNDFTKLIESIRIEREWDSLDRPRTAAWEIKSSSQPNRSVNKKREETAWKLVTNGRSKRRKSSNASSQEETSSKKGSPNTTPTKPAANPALSSISHSNVYSRLAYGKRTCNTAPGSTSEVNPPDLPTSKPQRNCSSPSSNGRFMAPKSAMDLPQTRASMAKMAYSRQLLWQQRKKQLAEKLVARQRHEQAIANCRRRRSLPSLVKVATTPIDGARAVDWIKNNKKVAAKTLKETYSLKEAAITVPSSSITNLESINESAEEEDPEDGSSMRTMAGRVGLAVVPVACRLNYMTRSEPPKHQAMDLSEDEEWRAMTEEEESLAQEEESLKKEIEEEESLSIDDEIQRRASSMDRSFDREDDEEKPLADIDPNISQAFHIAPPSGWRPTWKEVVSKWAVGTDSEDDLNMSKQTYPKASPKKDVFEEEAQSFSCLSVLPPTSLQTSQQYRRPGELALFRAKLLSPSRKKISDDKQLEERQQKAEELRLQLQEDKSQRLRELNQKVEEVKKKRTEIIERKRLHLEKLEQRNKKAEENRQRNLSEIVRKVKEDQQKVMEITFITTLDAENVKHELTESQGRVTTKVQSRMDTMAKERALRVEQKMAKETAAEERRKKTEQQRMEKLRETTTRKKERICLAEAQRNEQAEFLKERARQREHKLEQRKAIDLHENKNLRSRIQQKHEESSRRHEGSLEQVKLKAVVMCSPRPMQSWVTLADFSQIPSDVDYDIVVRKCTLCKVELSNDLQLISHICSDDHLHKACAGVQRDIYDALVDYEFLKDQLEDYIKEVDLEDESQIAQPITDENLEPCPSEATFENISSNGTTPMVVASPKCILSLKKKKTKLKQKLNKQMCDVLELCASSAETKKSLKNEKKIKDLLILLKEASLTDTQKTLIERSIAQMQKNFSQISKTEATKFAFEYFKNGFIEILVTFLTASSNDQSPGSVRIYFKSMLLMTNFIQANTSLAETLFSTTFLCQFCDLFLQKLKTAQADQATSLLNIIQLLLSSLTVKTAVSKSMSERVHILSQYLSLCGLEMHVRKIIDQATSQNGENLDKSNDKTAKESIEIGKDLTINKLDVAIKLVNQLICLSSTSPNGSNKDDAIVQLTLNVFKPIVHNLYAYCLGLQQQQGDKQTKSEEGEESRREEGSASTPRAASVADTSAMTTSIISTSAFGSVSVKTMSTSMMTSSINSSAKLFKTAIGGSKCVVLSSEIAWKLMSWLIELWIGIAACPNAKIIIQELFSTEPNAAFPIRLSYLFQSILNCCVKEWSKSNTKQSLLNKIILAVGYFSAQSQKTKLLCVLGWQRSLLSQLCTTLPSDYIHHADLRLVLMPSLVVVLLQNSAGIETIRNEFCLSWLITYLKDAMKQEKENASKYKHFAQMLNQKYWQESVEYFESKTSPKILNF